MSKIYARPFVVATLALTLAVGTAGCQTISDLDPTGLIGGNDGAPAPDTQFPPDSPQQATQDASTTTPDLASLPARPAQPDAAAQAATTQSVTASGAQAQYSADALRAGTDAAAPAPTATDAAGNVSPTCNGRQLRRQSSPTAEVDGVRESQAHVARPSYRPRNSSNFMNVFRAFGRDAAVIEKLDALTKKTCVGRCARRWTPARSAARATRCASSSRSCAIATSRTAP